MPKEDNLAEIITATLPIIFSETKTIMTDQVYRCLDGEVRRRHPERSYAKREITCVLNRLENQGVVLVGARFVHYLVNSC